MFEKGENYWYLYFFHFSTTISAISTRANSTDAKLEPFTYYKCYLWTDAGKQISC